MISSRIPKSFRGAGDFVVLGDLCKVGKTPRKITTKIIKQHQVRSTPKTLRKLAWNHLTVLWLNFEKNRSFLFVLNGPSPTYELKYRIHEKGPNSVELLSSLVNSPQSPNRILFLDMPSESTIERICYRSTDPVTGTRYHQLYDPPPSTNIALRFELFTSKITEKYKCSFSLWTRWRKFQVN